MNHMAVAAPESRMKKGLPQIVRSPPSSGQRPRTKSVGGWPPWARPGEHRVDIEYRWFGGPPGEPLPPLGDAVAKHTKANAAGIKTERPGIRKLKLTQFEAVDGTARSVDADRD